MGRGSKNIFILMFRVISGLFHCLFLANKFQLIHGSNGYVTFFANISQNLLIGWEIKRNNLEKKVKEPVLGIQGSHTLSRRRRKASQNKLVG